MSTFQSMDHSSAMKKTRQQLHESELGIAPVTLEIKKTSKPIQHTKRVIPQAKDTSILLETSLSDFRKKHTQDVSSLRSDISSIKSSFSESRRDLCGKLAYVDERFSDVKSKLEYFKKESEEVLSSLKQVSSATASKLDSLFQEISKLYHQLKNLESQFISFKKENESISSKMVDSKSIEDRVLSAQKSKYAEHDVQIKQLNAAVKDISSKLSYAEVAAKNTDHVKSLHIGDKFNLPEQPAIVKEGGLHKVAPLSLAVNGAVLLHDIGYTTDKKGLVPLYYDPVTQRALIYHGK